MPDASGTTQDDIPDDDDLVTRFAPKQRDDSGDSRSNGKRFRCLQFVTYNRGNVTYMSVFFVLGISCGVDQGF